MRILALLITLLFTTFEASADTGIEFLPNGEPIGNVYAFLFVDVDDNGLPYYGTSDGGVTLSWEIFPNDPPAPYSFWVTFFMDENDGQFGSNAFYGAHPYPWDSCGNQGGNRDGHAWEISSGINSARDDMFDNPGPGCESEAIDIIDYDRWHAQAFTAVRTDLGGGVFEVTLTFWSDLPSVVDKDVIIVTRTQDLGNKPIPVSLDLYFADAPWAASVSHHETLNGIFRNLKIWDGTKTEAFLTGAAFEDTQLLKTGDDELWYHNPNPTPSDISDKSGATANDPDWVDGTKLPTLWTSTDTVTAVGVQLSLLEEFRMMLKVLGMPNSY